MKTYSSLFVFNLVISTLCLGIGLISAESWLGLPVLLVFLACWVYSAGHPGFWRATCALSGYLILGAALVMRDAWVYLLIVSSVAALASWELILFKKSAVPANSTQTSLTSLERHHLKSLGLAAFFGLVVSLLATQIRIEIPFGMLVVVGLVTMGAMVFGLRFIQKQINSK